MCGVLRYRWANRTFCEQTCFDVGQGYFDCCVLPVSAALGAATLAAASPPLLGAELLSAPLRTITIRNAMALLVTSLALNAALASGMHRAPCFVGSSPSLRRSAPLLVQTWQPNEEHPNEAPATAQPRAEVGASFGLLRGRSTPRRELASEWIDAGVPKWVTLIDEALFVLASAMFVRGSLDFFPGVSAARYLEGCQLYVVGSTIYRVPGVHHLPVR